MNLSNLLNRYSWIILLGLSLFILGCARTTLVTNQPSQKTSLAKRKDFRMPDDLTHVAYASLKHSKIVYQFYSSRSFEIAWLNDSSSTLTDSLLSFLKSVRLYGLLPQDYHIFELENLQPESDTMFVNRKDALLTDAFLSLASDLKYGRLNSTVNSYNDSLNLRVLESAFDSGQIKKVLETQEPSRKQYADLKKSLSEILSAADSTNFRLLYAGITIDSIDVHKKVQRIEINMERWRSEILDSTQRYILINIPSFQLQVIENDQTILESRIIVGKPKSPTPVLSSLIECITLYPYWYIPRKIAIAEYLPVIQRDTSFLAKNNFDVLDRKGNIVDPDTLNWQSYTAKYFPVSLRQREGPDNSLGVIKFIFDNPYAVFLHDTNTKSLFRKKTRMFSHGCIRMEKALELAKYLAPDPEKVDSKLRLKERYTINLSKPIPIYTRYFTCEYIHDKLNFYEDIYGLDQPLIDLLYNQRYYN